MLVGLRMLLSELSLLLDVGLLCLPLVVSLLFRLLLHVGLLLHPLRLRVGLCLHRHHLLLKNDRGQLSSAMRERGRSDARGRWRSQYPSLEG